MEFFHVLSLIFFRISHKNCTLCIDILIFEHMIFLTTGIAKPVQGLGYRWWVWGIVTWCPVRTRDLSVLQSVQTDSGVLSISYSMVTGVTSMRITHLSIMLRLRMSETSLHSLIYLCGGSVSFTFTLCDILWQSILLPVIILLTCMGKGGMHSNLTQETSHSYHSHDFFQSVQANARTVP
jgi:hypothetical protein